MIRSGAPLVSWKNRPPKQDNLSTAGYGYPLCTILAETLGLGSSMSA